jgi:hypothetical protein
MKNSKRVSVSTLLAAMLACGYAPVSAQSGSGMGNTSQTRSEQSTGDASGAPSASGTAKSGAGATTVTVPMVVLVPVEVQTDPKLYNGCWVRLTDKDAMPKKGSDILTIVGWMYWPIDSPQVDCTA